MAKTDDGDGLADVVPRVADCVVCNDARIGKIDDRLRAKRSISGVAREFGFARATIARHLSHSAPKPSGITALADIDAKIDAIIKEPDKHSKLELDALKEKRAGIMDAIRLQQQAMDDATLTNHPAWHAHLKWLAGILNECASCKEALSTKYPGDTRTE